MPKWTRGEDGEWFLGDTGYSIRVVGETAAARPCTWEVFFGGKPLPPKSLRGRPNPWGWAFDRLRDAKRAGAALAKAEGK